MCLLRALEIQESCFSDMLVDGLIRSSKVTAASALMLVDTVLEMRHEADVQGVCLRACRRETKWCVHLRDPLYTAATNRPGRPG